jgi:two-component system CheB/CheR fusion protein
MSSSGESSENRESPATDKNFAIVGIGASAGGLQAFEQFFTACPADSGMAFVVVSHLDPSHDSLLGEILQRSTAMPVLEATDQLMVVADHVYIIPPGRVMTLLGGALQLSRPEEALAQRLPIDDFLRSLAADQAAKAIGVILSGTASDGSLGLRAILNAGGVCMVQEPSSARYDSMPMKAAAYATHILGVGLMPAALIELTRQAAFRLRLPRLLPANEADSLSQILEQIRADTGHDFSLYKKVTLLRRIQRRMARHLIDEMAHYSRFLARSPGEMQILFKEMLINVSSFFRDPIAFDLLKNEILPAQLADKPDGYLFRVWVAACASGEEAYSIAILLRELIEQTGRQIRIQIYATDLDDEAIACARSGHYPPSIAQDVSAERLRRFFIRDDGGYTICRTIREMVIFAVHSVIKDPPFIRLDLLSCRNLMIYLEPEQQERLIPSFHYAIKPGGILFLSPSESIAGDYGNAGLFSLVNGQGRFYRARDAAPDITLSWRSRVSDHRADRLASLPLAPGHFSPAPRTKPVDSIAEQSNRLLLKSYAPASVSTDGQGTILYVHGDISRYLKQPPGPLTSNVVDMTRGSLQVELREALAAASQGQPTIARRVAGDSDGAEHCFSVRLLPAKRRGEASGQSGQDANPFLLISFEPLPPSAAARPPRGQKVGVLSSAQRLAELEREQAYARASLEAIIAALQQSNEELKSANEEAQSTNDELKSVNEQLEISAEELQSLNEEVLTINAQLNAKVGQLTGIQSDMKNLLDNVNSGTLLLDQSLVIRRYTPEALKIYPLIESDLGRPLQQIRSNLVGDDLLAEISAVLGSSIPREREVRTVDGAWYLTRIQPYLTVGEDDAEANAEAEGEKSGGLVVTFTEVTEFKRASEVIKRSEVLLRTAQEIGHVGSWDYDVASGRAVVSDGVVRIFALLPGITTMSFDEVVARIDGKDRQRMATLFRDAIDANRPFESVYRIVLPDGGKREIYSRAVPIQDFSGQVEHMVGCSLDITELRVAREPSFNELGSALAAAEGLAR